MAIGVYRDDVAVAKNFSLGLHKQSRDAIASGPHDLGIIGTIPKHAPTRFSTGNPVWSMACLLVATILDAVRSRRSCKPRKAIWTSPMRSVRVYTSSCLFTVQSVERKEQGALNGLAFDGSNRSGN